MMTTEMEDRSWTVANCVGERRRANWMSARIRSMRSGVGRRRRVRGRRGYGWIVTWEGGSWWIIGGP
jgi:hypothetical protein